MPDMDAAGHPPCAASGDSGKGPLQPGRAPDTQWVRISPIIHKKNPGAFNPAATMAGALFCPAMPYTLTEAATATGMNRSTVLRAIKAGKLSGARDRNGAWTIEPVELHRVFPAATASAAHAPMATPQDAMADALVAQLREQLADMTGQRDAWQRVAERLALAAPGQPEPPHSPWRRAWRWMRKAG